MKNSKRFLSGILAAAIAGTFGVNTAALIPSAPSDAAGFGV